MKYYSTRDKNRQNPFSLKDAAFAGLAPDGGLFIPEYIPQVDMAKVESLAEKSYADMAIYLAQTVFDDIPPEDMDLIVRDAYDFPIKLNSISEGLYNLELFHGPTYAFKDVLIFFSTLAACSAKRLNSFWMLLLSILFDDNLLYKFFVL